VDPRCREIEKEGNWVGEKTKRGELFTHPSSFVLTRTSPFWTAKRGKGKSDLYILRLPGRQGAGLKVLLQKLHHLLFSLGDLKIRILAEAVKKDDGVQNLPANDAMPSVEDIVHIVKLLEDHPAAATLTAYRIRPFLVRPFLVFFAHGVC
jgi:hypothetical protein